MGWDGMISREREREKRGGVSVLMLYDVFATIDRLGVGVDGISVWKKLCVGGVEG